MLGGRKKNKHAKTYRGFWGKTLFVGQVTITHTCYNYLWNWPSVLWDLLPIPLPTFSDCHCST